MLVPCERAEARGEQRAPRLPRLSWQSIERLRQLGAERPRLERHRGRATLVFDAPRERLDRVLRHVERALVDDGKVRDSLLSFAGIQPPPVDLQVVGVPQLAGQGRLDWDPRIPLPARERLREHGIWSVTSNGRGSFRLHVEPDESIRRYLGAEPAAREVLRDYPGLERMLVTVRRRAGDPQRWDQRLSQELVDRLAKLGLRGARIDGGRLVLQPPPARRDGRGLSAGASTAAPLADLIEAGRPLFATLAGLPRDAPVELVEATELTASARDEIAPRSLAGDTSNAWDPLSHEQRAELDLLELIEEHQRSVSGDGRGQRRTAAPPATPTERGAKRGASDRRREPGSRRELLEIERFLGKRVIGHQQALAAVADEVRIQRTTAREQRSMPVIMLVGPTGVGKTELAKALAAWIDEREMPAGERARAKEERPSLLHLSMERYRGGDKINELFGSAPGYVNHEEGGQLLNFIRGRPKSVLLFDEFEKAHPEVQSSLLRIFDESRTTDPKGRGVDFREAVAILTSNAITGPATHHRGIGYREQRRDTERSGGPQPASGWTEGALREELVRQGFAPELVNRIDAVLFLEPLDASALRQIAELKLGPVAEAHGVKLDVSPRALEALVAAGTSPTEGARPLDRAIKRLIRGPLAKRMLQGRVRSGDTVHVELSEESDGLELTVRPSR